MFTPVGNRDPMSSSDWHV